MAVLWQKIKLRGSKGERLDALFDSDATYSFIRTDIAEKVEQLIPLPEPWEFGTAEKGRKIVVTEHISVSFYLDDTRFSDEFLVTDEISEEVIIGAKTMQSWRFKLDFENEKVLFDPKVTRLVII